MSGEEANMQGPISGRMSTVDFETLLKRSADKLELLEGEVLAFARGPVAHGILCTRLVAAVNAVTIGPCQTFTSGVAVRVDSRASYMFPDVSHTFEPLDPQRNGDRARSRHRSDLAGKQKP